MRANPHTTPGTTNGGRISWVPYVWACAIRQTPSSTAISDAIRHIARVRTYATCGIPYRLTSSPGHLTGYACQGIHDWTEPNNQQATKHTPGKSRMSRHTQLARKVRQVTPATYHPPRRVRPDIRNLTEPQPHRHPASAFDTRRMQRHTQPDGRHTRTTEPPTPADLCMPRHTQPDGRHRTTAESAGTWRLTHAKTHTTPH